MNESTDTVRVSWDAPWKALLEHFLQPLLQLFAPNLHDLIDWNTPVQFLDTELQRLTPDSATNTQVVDKLAQVQLRNGQHQWILVHVEVQATPQTHFSERMYAYHARIWLEHRRPVVSLALLADRRRRWNPREYRFELAGCSVRFRYLTVKLIQYDEQVLEALDNPCGLLVSAYLTALKTEGNLELRLREKMRLVRALVGRGYNLDTIREAFRVLDWFMSLKQSELYQRAFMEYLRELGGGEVPLLSSFEYEALERGFEQGMEQGIERGIQQGIEQGIEQGIRDTILRILQARFGSYPASLPALMGQIHDVSLLEQLSVLAVQVESLEAFIQRVQEQVPLNGI